MVDFKKWDKDSVTDRKTLELKSVNCLNIRTHYYYSSPEEQNLSVWSPFGDVMFHVSDLAH